MHVFMLPIAGVRLGNMRAWRTCRRVPRRGYALVAYVDVAAHAFASTQILLAVLAESGPLSSARRTRVSAFVAFVALVHKIVKHRGAIETSIDHKF
ncbi:MAG: hypothetical protein QOE61_4684 [Micromonosporaceae bacterium]|jgi:hypothetical protein|nr:hypothetical protein [Micromonosporaceae bacterium]